MIPNDAQHKIHQLSTELEQHNYNYYVLDNPTISDYEFDKMLEELIALEKQFSSSSINVHVKTILNRNDACN